MDAEKDIYLHLTNTEVGNHRAKLICFHTLPFTLNKDLQGYTVLNSMLKRYKINKQKIMVWKYKAAWKTNSYIVFGIYKLYNRNYPNNSGFMLISAEREF